MFCYKCGKKISEESSFCMYCGKEMPKNIETVSTKPVRNVYQQDKNKISSSPKLARDFYQQDNSQTLPQPNFVSDIYQKSKNKISSLDTSTAGVLILIVYIIEYFLFFFIVPILIITREGIPIFGIEDYTESFRVYEMLTGTSQSLGLYRIDVRIFRLIGLSFLACCAFDIFMTSKIISKSSKPETKKSILIYSFWCGITGPIAVVLLYMFYPDEGIRDSSSFITLSPALPLYAALEAVAGIIAKIQLNKINKTTTIEYEQEDVF